MYGFDVKILKLKLRRNLLMKEETKKELAISKAFNKEMITKKESAIADAFNEKIFIKEQSPLEIVFDEEEK